ncbi:hypothetical protein E4T47_06435 [Aureobasidium subglaciale]|nr:hypothetical protein E4T47_06435 [Aureobasidium subglaciale]
MTFVRLAIALKISRQDSPLLSPSDKPTATAASYENVYIRNPELKNILRLPDGSIELRSSTENLSIASRSLLLYVDGRNRGRELYAGLTVYKDCYRYIAIFFNYRDSKSDRLLDKATVQLQIRAPKKEY